MHAGIAREVACRKHRRTPSFDVPQRSFLIRAGHQRQMAYGNSRSVRLVHDDLALSNLGNAQHRMLYIEKVDDLPIGIPIRIAYPPIDINAPVLSHETHVARTGPEPSGSVLMKIRIGGFLVIEIAHHSARSQNTQLTTLSVWKLFVRLRIECRHDDVRQRNPRRTRIVHARIGRRHRPTTFAHPVSLVYSLGTSVLLDPRIDPPFCGQCKVFASNGQILEAAVSPRRLLFSRKEL